MILVQQIYNFENNIKQFYIALEHHKKIEKISIPSLDNLWDDKLLIDTIKLCQEYIKENIALAGDITWSKLLTELGVEAERRYNLNLFFNKAKQSNALMDINKMPDDIVNLATWMVENAKNEPKC